MNPFFFGDSKAPLYGVYHKPETANISNQCVLLLPPFGQEYMRSHRAVRQLAMMLARRGVPVLRFDYRGTGDSAGDLRDMTPENWVDDANIAIDELKETSGHTKVSLVALRLSGLIAWTAASQRSDIDSVLLWDSTISGTQYLDELKAQIVAKPNLSRSNYIAPDGTLNYNGFAFSHPFQEALVGFDLSARDPATRHDTIQLVTQKTVATEQLKKRWSRSSNYLYEHIDAPGDWNYVDENGGILLPQPIIQYIVNHYVKEEAA